MNLLKKKNHIIPASYDLKFYKFKYAKPKIYKILIIQKIFKIDSLHKKK